MDQLQGLIGRNWCLPQQSRNTLLVKIQTKLLNKITFKTIQSINQSIIYIYIYTNVYVDTSMKHYNLCIYILRIIIITLFFLGNIQ